MKSLGANYIGTYYAALFRFLINPRSPLFVGGKDQISWWNHGGNNERIRHTSAAAVYYKTARTQVIAFHFSADFAWRERKLYQNILGGGNGLRGFPYYEFSGNRIAVGNIEYRFFLPVEILTIRPGGAMFYDIGNAWQPNDRIRARDLKSDIGFGLRFGLLKSAAANVIRLDVARSLSNNAVFVSFGNGTTFNLEFPTDIQ